ncbi:hypothetical protein CKO44_14115 [Rubrivivax gelatinosus]|uniref:Acg family FMN-binding oxidoreductase n=1 Tax=Rubrivivax gelatinosus TaxID=28068 RepID=UPI001907E345|nr:hypothetical protein [Rubrivivax gelatinosus]MBK1614605.1 hypothetical protein [Rubrivivax gelatinosus]
MTTRRRCLTLGAAAIAGGALAGCDERAEQDAAARLQRRLAPPGSVAGAARLRALVHAATLAPSSHNTQCWRFSLGANTIRIGADFSRRCPAVDPDDHHLFVSLGCAAENLVQAALAHGLQAEPQVAADGAITVALAPTPPRRTAAYDAIAARQCTRGAFDGRPLAPAQWQRLDEAAAAEGVTRLIVSDRAGLERVLDAVAAGHRAQLSDAAFVDELVHWLRFDTAEAARSGDGLFAGCSGQPSMPPWLARRIVRRFLRADSEIARSAEQLRSSAGVVIFASDAAAGPQRWVGVGRAFQRLALEATAAGLRLSLLNPPLEVARLRAPFASAFGLAPLRPDLIVRIGHGPRLPDSLRRPLQAVIA